MSCALERFVVLLRQNGVRSYQVPPEQAERDQRYAEDVIRAGKVVLFSAEPGAAARPQLIQRGRYN
jgi:hypothetical protein